MVFPLSSVLTPAAAKASSTTTSGFAISYADRQRRACALVCEQHTLTAAHVEGLNSALSFALKHISIYTFDGWAWIYNSVAAVRQGAESGTGARLFKRSWR